MKEIDKNGIRMYVFDTPKTVPNIQDLMKNPENNIDFIKSVTLNPRNENAELYSYFSSDTYRSFLYAFTYQIGYLNPTSVICPQFEMNAKRFEKLCKKRNIVLTELEKSIVEKCTLFHDIDLVQKDRTCLSDSLLSKLIDYYY